MTDRELFERALDALDSDNPDIQLRTAIALRDRLVQTEPGPVAWELREGKTDRVLIEITNNPERARNWRASLNEVVPLYTTPPQRPWVGLTDEEIDHAAEQSDNYASFTAGALFAQDKLEEKNT